jgi:hypothetical protein
MKRLLTVAAALSLCLIALAPAALAAEPMATTGRVLISTQGDVSLPAGDQADVVVVVSGTADIQGEVKTLVVVDGTANLTNARLETVVAVRSRVEVGPGTVVLGEVQRLDATIHQAGDAEIVGGITDLAGVLTEFGAVLGPALVLLWLGFGLATIVAALAVAGLATRQVREAERLISAEPLATGVTGLVSVLLLPAIAIALITTLIGAPLGVGFLIGVLPLVAFAGYLVAGIWIGDWILGRMAPGTRHERPYLAAVLGVLVLEVIAVVPILTVIVAIASVVGFGALVRLAIQAMRGTPQAYAPASRPMAAATQA